MTERTTDDYASVVRWTVIENCVTLLVAGAIIVGLFAMGAGGWCSLGVIVLANLNGPVKRGGDA